MHDVNSSSKGHLFVCHADASKEAISPILRDLLETGYRLFVDNPSSFVPFGLKEYALSEQLLGISGTWHESINTAIRECSVFLSILNADHIANFYNSPNCEREVRTCVDNNRPILSIHVGSEKLINETLRNNWPRWGDILDAQMYEATPGNSSFSDQMDLARAQIQKLIKKNTVPPVHEPPGPADDFQPTEVPQARIGWLRWIDLKGGVGRIPTQPRPWPITLGAAVGIDRGRQVALCHGLDTAAVLNELNALETVVGSLGGQHPISPRTWTRLDNPEQPTRSANIVWQVSRMADRDMIEGVLVQHFRTWGGSHGVSAVLVLPSENAAELTRVGEFLAQCLTVRDHLISVACFLPWDTDRVVSLLTDLQKANLYEIGLADRLFLPTASPSVDAPPGNTLSKLLRRWVDGTVKDADFFANATLDDVRLAIIAGQLGNPEKHSFKPQEDRARALVYAARETPSLRVALSSLPLSPTLIHSLADEPITLRAVLGFISGREASECPLPWAFEPVDETRHGRSLIV